MPLHADSLESSPRSALMEAGSRSSGQGLEIELVQQQHELKDELRPPGWPDDPGSPHDSFEQDMAEESNGTGGDESLSATTAWLQPLKLRVGGPSSWDDNWFYLDHNCYAAAVLPRMPLYIACLLPPVTCGLQIVFLVFVALDDNVTFASGHWLQPQSEFPQVNYVKALCLVVSLFRVYAKLQDAMMLWAVVHYGDLDGPARRLVGRMAICMQYAMCLAVLFTGTSLIMSAQSSGACIGKIFAVSIALMIDGLLARFIEVMFGLDFRIEMDSEGLRAGLLGGQVKITSSGKHLQHLKRYRYRNETIIIFIAVPLLAISIECLLAYSTNTLPITYLRFGRVSNHNPPEMIHNVAGCCPPVRIDAIVGSRSANYSIIVLGLIEETALAGSSPPDLHWVVLHSQPEPVAPSSFQVMRGTDGEGNRASLSGVVRSEAVQAGHYFQTHGFADGVYPALLEHKQLHRRVEPFSGSFGLEVLQPGMSYRAYVTAQTPRTLALAADVLASAMLTTSACAPNCERCEELGPSRCDMCAQDFHVVADGSACLPCDTGCENCSRAAAAGVLDLRTEGVLECNAGGCSRGFKPAESGRCASCGVYHCDRCDGAGSDIAAGVNSSDVSEEPVLPCDECSPGFGRRHTRDNESGLIHIECMPCAAERCLCSDADGCDSCEVGYGLSPGGLTCEECADGCADCNQVSNCSSCEPGRFLVGSQCEECSLDCVVCSDSLHCDECQSGFGLMQRVDRTICRQCRVEHCAQCDGNDSKCRDCAEDYGRTQNGRCARCGDFCALCSISNECLACHQSYTLGDDGGCWRCADGCRECNDQGQGKCDPYGCMPGFVHDNSTRTCRVGNSVEHPLVPRHSGPSSARRPQCWANSGCAHLAGDCCPASSGSMLACCGTGLDVAGCTDSPTGWRSSAGTSCAAYERLGYCTVSGDYGPGWDLGGSGAFEDWQSAGYTAATACCACGGGVVAA